MFKTWWAMLALAVILAAVAAVSGWLICGWLSVAFAIGGVMRLRTSLPAAGNSVTEHEISRHSWF